MSFTVVFFLKAVIYSVNLYHDDKQKKLMNFVLSFIRSIGTDLITFLLYTFILEMREVLLTIYSMSEHDFLNRSIHHRRLKVAIYIVFGLIRVFLQACKIILLKEYIFNQPVLGWKIIIQ